MCCIVYYYVSVSFAMSVENLCTPSSSKIRILQNVSLQLDKSILRHILTNSVPFCEQLSISEHKRLRLENGDPCLDRASTTENSSHFFINTLEDYSPEDILAEKASFPSAEFSEYLFCDETFDKLIGIGQELPVLTTADVTAEIGLQNCDDIWNCDEILNCDNFLTNPIGTDILANSICDEKGVSSETESQNSNSELLIKQDLVLFAALEILPCKIGEHIQENCEIVENLEFLEKIRTIGNSRVQINKIKLKEKSRAVKQRLENVWNILVDIEKQWIKEFTRKKPLSKNVVDNMCYFNDRFFPIFIRKCFGRK